MSKDRPNHDKPITARRCCVCLRATEGELYCSRACVLKRQKDVFGATLRELVAHRDLKITNQYRT